MATPKLLSELLAFDRREVHWIIAGRCTAGLGASVLIYSLAGHASWGVLASLGALYAGLASYTGIFQSRMRHMFATAIVITVQAMFGTAVGASNWGAIACVTLVGFVCSLYAALRPSANLLATYATACTIIFSKVLPVHTDVARAALGNGLIVLSGAALQMLALSMLWPFTRFYPERRAVAAAYRSLAEFAQRVSGSEEPEMLNTSSIQDAHETLDTIARYQAHPEQVILRRALSAAEGIRAALVALSSLPKADKSALGDWLAQLARALDTTAARLLAGRALHPEPLEELSPPQHLQPVPSAIVSVVGDFLRRLDAPAEAAPPTESHDNWKSHLSFRIIALENSRTLRSMALLHAVRMGAAMFLASCMGRFGGLPFGYWIPLTTCIVLRTDYATTLSRGFARAAGAIAGVLLSILIAAAMGHAVEAHTTIFMIAGFGIFAVYRASYTAYSTLITVWVISSLSAAGVPEHVAGWFRLEDTVIGTAIAFAAYRLLPTWQSRRVQEVLREASLAQAAFCRRVLLAPVLPTRLKWERELDSARAIRYEAESVVGAASKEPSWSRHRPLVPVEDALMDLERNAAQILSLLAQRLASPVLTPEVAAEATAASAAAERFASGVNERQSVV